MSVCGIMLVRDEADIIERSVQHLRSQVDWLLVSNNRSTDGTREILASMPEVDLLVDDDEVGYFQARKMTALAGHAHERGFAWVVPCDADELWTADAGTVAEHLNAQPPNVQIVQAALYDYLPPAEGLGGEHPFDAITWRRGTPGALPKVACRTHPTLQIAMGNHSASYSTKALSVPGLTVRHFTWRTREQYLRKIRNGMEAYAATDLDPMYGAHWRMFEGASDEAIMEHFDTWFTAEASTETLVHDPIGG